MLNLITDIPGIRVGNAHDEALISGVTALVFDQPVAASVSVLGGAPGGRDLGCLEPDAAVGSIDAIVLAGGSGFGLDAASGVQACLREHGRGFPVGAVRVPIVPSAICFDLLNGGDKDWKRYPPYRELGFAAASAARTGAFGLGSVGGGYGAATADLKGGLGSASVKTAAGHRVAAIVVVNALGSAMMGRGPHFWAAPLERDAEFGGLGWPAGSNADCLVPVWKGAANPPPATTIACVATDARLDKAATKRLAVAANAGLARGLRLSHALMDGDTIFAVATGGGSAPSHHGEVIEIGAAAADCLARAIARGVYAAETTAARWAGPPAWCDRFGLRPR